MSAGGAARYPSLRDRAVLVTGGAAGIGAAIVEHFADQGACVAFLDIADDKARALVARLAPAVHHPPLYAHCDLTDIAALRAAIASLASRTGAFRVLINNAGNDDRHAFETVTPAYWDERMAVNLRHQFFAAQAVHPAMRDAGGGAVVNLSSTSWTIGEGGYAAYTTAKAGVIGLTRSLARDMGPDNIRVNAILPGWIATERQVALWLTPEAEREWQRRQTLARRLVPADVARMALFAASDDAGAITAHGFVVDGGYV